MDTGIRYIAFGDSLTRGVGASHKDYCFPNLYFNGIRQTNGCQFINLGRSGMNSTELLQYIQKREIQHLVQQATDITITIGGNDLIRTYKQNGTLLHYFIALYYLKHNMKHILHNIWTTNPYAQTLLMGLYNPGPPDHPLHDRADDFIQRVNHIYENLVAAYESVHFIDPYPYFSHKQHLLADEIHPNDRGYKTMYFIFMTKRRECISTPT